MPSDASGCFPSRGSRERNSREKLPLGRFGRDSRARRCVSPDRPRRRSTPRGDVSRSLMRSRAVYLDARVVAGRVASSGRVVAASRLSWKRKSRHIFSSTPRFDDRCCVRFGNTDKIVFQPPACARAETRCLQPLPGNTQMALFTHARSFRVATSSRVTSCSSSPPFPWCPWWTPSGRNRRGTRIPRRPASRASAPRRRRGQSTSPPRPSRPPGAPSS